MSIGSIMQNIFGNTPAQQVPTTPQNQQAQQLAAQQAQVAQQTQNLATKSDAGTAPNGTVPANTPAPEPKSGLDKFADVWQTTQDPNVGAGQPLFNIDNEKVMAAARAMDFTKDVMTPELATKIAAGGPEAVQAMMQAMGTISQNSFAQSAQATMKLIEGAVKREGYVKETDIASKVRQYSTSATLQEQTNPVFKSAAASPIVKGLETQFLQKFPQATPSEIAGMVNEYLAEFSKAFQAPELQKQQEQKKAGEEDWSKFFG